MSVLTQHETETGRLCRALRLVASEDGKSVLLVETDERKAGIQRETRFEITTGELVALIRAEGDRTPRRTAWRRPCPSCQRFLIAPSGSRPRSFTSSPTCPPEAEWFANLDNPRTRRAYQADLRDFMSFTAITRPEDFRIVTRAHVLAWRKVLEDRALSGATIRRKLAALSSLFEYLCEKNAVDFNPVKGAKRPKVDSNEGKTAALGDHQARAARCARPSHA
jgi:hypothetical protein